MEYAGLYGLLPLFKNMPVAVTEHIDRGAEKLILRGRIGYIHSWILSSTEKSVFENGRRVLNTLPEVVYVKFVNDNGKDLSWRMPDLSENGVYPVVPVKRTWFLSEGKRYRIIRKQLPLKPAFAINAHAAQGQTYSQGVIVDLAGRRKATGAVPAYVALTRVKRREDLIRCRPFPLELFRQGQKPSLNLLLRIWRGETINWVEIENEYMPRRTCVGCLCRKFQKEYTKTEWEKKHKQVYCIECLLEFKMAGKHFQCNACYVWLPETAFASRLRTLRFSRTRVCDMCSTRNICHQHDAVNDKVHKEDTTMGVHYLKHATQQSAVVMELCSKRLNDKMTHHIVSLPTVVCSQESLNDSELGQQPAVCKKRVLSESSHDNAKRKCEKRVKAIDKDHSQ